MKALVPPSAWRSRVARVTLLVGVALLVIWWSKRGPREQWLVFDLDGDASTARELRVSWSRVGDDQPLGGASLSVRGARTIRHRISVPNGSYSVEATVQRARPDGSVDESTTVRRVALEGGETRVPLHDDR